MANVSHHSSDILPVLKSLAARAVTALSLEHAGYKSVSDFVYSCETFRFWFRCLVGSLDDVSTSHRFSTLIWDDNPT